MTTELPQRTRSGVASPPASRLGKRAALGPEERSHPRSPDRSGECNARWFLAASGMPGRLRKREGLGGGGGRSGGLRFLYCGASATERSCRGLAILYSYLLLASFSMVFLKISSAREIIQFWEELNRKARGGVTPTFILSRFLSGEIICIFGEIHKRGNAPRNQLNWKQ